MQLSKQLLRLARFTYHRMPVPLHVKWKMRDAIAPVLKALNESGTNGELFRRLLETGKQLNSGPDQEERLREAELALIRDLAVHCRQYGPMTHLIALPFLGAGGAERTAIHFAKAINEDMPRSSVGIILTDRSLISDSIEIPAHVCVIDLAKYLPKDLTTNARVDFLCKWLLCVRPQIFHVINSDLGWQAIIAQGGRLAKEMRLYGSIFAFQFMGNDNKRIGYAEYYLRDAVDALHGLMSDNARFLRDAQSTFALRSSDHKMSVVYNACRVAHGDWVKQARGRIDAMSAIAQGKRLKVLWAGRLDSEKRIDLLFDTAVQCPDYDFLVFGESVVGEMPNLPKIKNLYYGGSFSDPAELVEKSACDVFMFTSKWEGMPNMLLEMGSLGIPIVAPDVGGVSELISDSTGFLVPARATVHDYASALSAIAGNRPDAQKRALCLIDLIEQRHTWPAFSRSLRDVPGYLGQARVEGSS
ncbi:glycosyltransferase family 4 protein [Cupriavidus sp. TA19]|uniref:glycosyltransferase family 4 protein n=1 Tax=Cupriavidus sp. TA19 TaxID=701108 RepID=UPI00295EA955|nr:glycosyltransferase family 4 protein [Cupriavidus sp. TA19]